MAINIRRVVTGHDSAGRAVVLHDGVAENVISQREKQERALIWVTDTLPADNDGSDDAGAREVGVGLKGGTVFGIVKFDPGCQPRIHRTDTIDYGVVLSGSIVMEMDGGEVELRAGDVFVQRGTVHAWNNRGAEPCLLAVTMVDAKAVEIDGKPLPPI